MMQSLVIGMVIIPLIMAACGASAGAIMSTIMLNIFISFAIHQWNKLFRYNKERKLRKQGALQPAYANHAQASQMPQNGEFIQVINIHPPQGYQNAKQVIVNHQDVQNAQKSNDNFVAPNEHKNREGMLEL